MENANVSLDMDWLLDSRVVDAKVSFTRALYKLDIFSRHQAEVEAIFRRLISWEDMHGLFMQLAGLAESRAAAHANSNELLQQLALAEEDLEMRYRQLQNVAADVLCESFKQSLPSIYGFSAAHSETRPAQHDIEESQHRPVWQPSQPRELVCIHIRPRICVRLAGNLWTAASTGTALMRDGLPETRPEY